MYCQLIRLKWILIWSDEVQTFNSEWTEMYLLDILIPPAQLNYFLEYFYFISFNFIFHVLLSRIPVCIETEQEKLHIFTFLSLILIFHLLYFSLWFSLFSFFVTSQHFLTQTPFHLLRACVFSLSYHKYSAKFYGMRVAIMWDMLTVMTMQLVLVALFARKQREKKTKELTRIAEYDHYYFFMTELNYFCLPFLSHSWHTTPDRNVVIINVASI